MTQTQKKIFEIPLILLLIWFWQVLEIWIARIPMQSGSLQLVPILITYVALTRTWGKLTAICFFLALVASFNVGFSKNVFLAMHLWGALVTKLFSSEFAIEGRRPFMLLAGGAHVFVKLFTWICLKYTETAPTLGYYGETVFLSTLATLGLAYLVFPYLVGWDEYFEHPIAESRDLNPDKLK